MHFLKSVGGALAIMLASAVAASAFPATSTTSLNVRSGPGTNYRVIDTLRPGETVEVTGQRGSWYRIEGGGWASAAYLAARGGGATVYEEEVYIDDGPYYYGRPYIGFGYSPWRYHRHHWRGHRPHRWRPGHHWRPGHGHWNRPGRPGRPGHHYNPRRGSGGIAKFDHQRRGGSRGGPPAWIRQGR